MKTDAHSLLRDSLTNLQRLHHFRMTLALVLLMALAALIAHYAYDLWPKHYQLTISGGGILDNKHFLARMLQQEAGRRGLQLKILPGSDSAEALDRLDQGEVDLLLTQASLRKDGTRIEHVAMLPPEVLHLLVKPSIQNLEQLRKKYINTGEQGSEAQNLARQILAYSGLDAGEDYSELNHDTETLFRLSNDSLPDAVLLLTMAPSPVADFLVKQRGYQLLEVPFPASLAKRYGWAADTVVLSHMYNVMPAIPARDIRSIGVRVQLLARHGINQKAVLLLLETLYSVNMSVRTHTQFRESEIATEANFPIAPATLSYMDRNNPLLSAALYGKLQSGFALLMSIVSAFLIVVKWLKGEKMTKQSDDRKFLDYIRQVAELEMRVNEACQHPPLTMTMVLGWLHELDQIKLIATQSLQANNIEAKHLPQTLYAAISDTRLRLSYLQQRIMALKTAAASP